MTCRALGSVGYPDAPSGAATDPSDHDSELLARHVYPLLIMASTDLHHDGSGKQGKGRKDFDTCSHFDFRSRISAFAVTDPQCLPRARSSLHHVAMSSLGWKLDANLVGRHDSCPLQVRTRSLGTARTHAMVSWQRSLPSVWAARISGGCQYSNVDVVRITSLRCIRKQ